MPLTLVHLISDQSWQNLLPMLAFQPSSVLHLCSHGDRWEHKAAAIDRAYQQHMHETGESASIPSSRVLSSSSANPNIAETLALFQRASEAVQGQVIINLTGGTKLMAIAAYDLARQHQIPSFYLETRDRRMIDCCTGPLPPHEPLSALTARLSVRTGLIANGFPPDALHSRQPTEAQLRFGKQAAVLRGQHSGCINQWLQKLRKQLPIGKPRVDSHVLRGALQHALPDPRSEAAESYAEAAAEAGVFRYDLSGRLFFANPPSATDPRTILGYLRNTLQLLEGGWLELETFRRFQESGAYSDVLWSVQSLGSNSHGETDIIAFHPETLRLVFVSCKAGRIEKPLEHIEALRARSKTAGGLHSQAVLVRFQPPNSDADPIQFCKVHQTHYTTLENIASCWQKAS